jgi:glycosyltransferase involved in cell wall biosynthesis
MRLGFYYHIPAIMQNEDILMPGYLGLFLDTLAAFSDELTLFLHLPNPGENAKFDYEIQSTNVKLISLQPRGSVPNRLLHAHFFAAELTKHLESLDALMMRGPTPLLPAFAEKAKHIPTILLLVGDYLAGVDSLPQPLWRKELIRLWSRYNYWGQLKAANHSLVFVNSHTLFKQFDGKIKNLIETRTTTITKDDFYTREDTCLSRPIHLIYTGRMDPAKGLLDMVSALAILIGQGEDVVLDLVGWPEDGSNVLSIIDLAAKQEGVKDRVVYHGYKAVGPDLFAYYVAADIYVIASQSCFEGFPRTIWEAMAHSLPVVATRVGSIPDFIEGAAELVEPKNHIALADGILKIIKTPELRKRNIRNGYSLAEKNTLEEQVGEMATHIIDWIRK